MYHFSLNCFVLMVIGHLYPHYSLKFLYIDKWSIQNEVLNVIVEWVAACCSAWEVLSANLSLEVTALTKVLWFYSVCKKMPDQDLKLRYDHVVPCLRHIII
jgi:hypothetical protein